MDSTDLRCRVCGLKLQSPPWGLDGASPEFDYCPCCGVEFGYEDATLAGIRSFRKKWLASGAIWNDPSARPEHWIVEDQLTEIPDRFR
jgi:hypothetical protein